MKKILLSLLLLFTITLIQAQIKKGTHFLGGSLGIYAEKTTSDTGANLVSSLFTFTPAYGRAVKDNLIFGGDLIVQTGTYESIYNIEDRNNYGAGIFLRKYIDLGKKFYFFTEVRFSGYYDKVEAVSHYFPEGNYNRKGFTIQAGFYPGVAFAVTKKFHIETGFNNLLYAQYSKTKTHYMNSLLHTETNRFTIGSNLSSFNGFLIGFRFVFG